MCMTKEGFAGKCRANHMKAQSALEVSECVARIEVTLDQALTQNTDQETRVRRLERALWMAAGFTAAGGGLIGGVVTKLIGLA